MPDEGEDPALCVLCGEPIADGETTVTLTGGQPAHRECYCEEVDCDDDGDDE